MCNVVHCHLASTMQTLFLENTVSLLGHHQLVGQSSPVEANEGADDTSTSANRSTPSTTHTTQSTPMPIVSLHKGQKGSHGKHTTGAQPRHLQPLSSGTRQRIQTTAMPMSHHHTTGLGAWGG